MPNPKVQPREVIAKAPWFEIARLENTVDVSLYGEIGWEVTASEFVALIDQVDDAEDIVVHINSVGGNVFEGLAIYNRLLRHKGHVTAIVEGFAASMASVISMAANRVEMMQASLFMIHNPAGGAWGEAKDFRKAAETLDQIREVLVSAYQLRVEDRDQIVAWMDAETWFTATEALEIGFVDAVLEADLDIAACADGVDFSQFVNLPAGVGVKPKPQQEAKPMPTPNKPTPAADVSDAEVVDINAARQDGVEQERERVRDITALFSQHRGQDTLLRECVDKGYTLDQARAKLLDALTPDPEPTADAAKPGGAVIGGQDARDRYIEGATRAILARAGLAEDDTRNEFRGYHMVDFARFAMENLHRRSLSGLDRMAIVGEAFTHGTDDFDAVLANVASKSLMRGYDETEEVYPKLVRIVSMSDFKSAKIAGLSAFSDLDEVGENGEYRQGNLSDYGENAQLTTFGKLFNISRHAIINDDLGAFTNVPRSMGRSARRKIGDLVASLLAGSGHTLDQDGKALFHADHANTGSAAPSTAAFEAMRTAMAKQTDPSGNANINVRPAFLYVPAALWSTSQQVVSSETEIAASQNNSRRPNTAQGIVREVLYDARLDAEDAAAWYGLADPNMHDTIALGLLDGRDAPTLEQQALFTRDGTSFKVRVDAVAEALDFRSIYRGNNT